MIKSDEKRSQLKIIIPITGIEKLSSYQKGIRGLLRKIEVGDCDPELKEDIKEVYELLSHLNLGNSHLKNIVDKKNRKVVQ